MCESINPKYEEVCKEEKNPRFCQYCNGTSGLSREKEEKYLELRIKQKENKLYEPNPIKKIINLSKALIEHSFHGASITTESELKKRLDTCKECEFFQPDADKCSRCGCYLSIKASWMEQHCPINKW